MESSLESQTSKLSVSDKVNGRDRSHGGPTPQGAIVEDEEFDSEEVQLAERNKDLPPHACR